MNNNNNFNRYLWEQKVGYDAINKKMVARIYDALVNVVKHNKYVPVWANIMKEMFELEGLSFNMSRGYYSTIRRILLDIKVIRYQFINNKKSNQLEPAENWDRFTDDNEDWSWFIAHTQSSGYGEIIK